jgi:hypothetical protein
MKRKLPFFLFPLLLLSSCVTTIEIHKTSSEVPASSDRKKWETTVPSFLFGFVNPVKNIKARERCHTDWHTIGITKSFLHIFTSFLTLGFYTPSKVIITCEKTEAGDEFERFNGQKKSSKLPEQTE